VVCWYMYITHTVMHGILALVNVLGKGGEQKRGEQSYMPMSLYTLSLHYLHPPVLLLGDSQIRSDRRGRHVPVSNQSLCLT